MKSADRDDASGGGARLGVCMRRMEVHGVSTLKPVTPTTDRDQRVSGIAIGHMTLISADLRLKLGDSRPRTRVNTVPARGKTLLPTIRHQTRSSGTWNLL